MAVKLNERAFEQAQELIADRRFAIDDREAWSEHRPSPRDATEFIAAHGWDAYGRWHLGVEDALPARTKPHYRFPYGDFRAISDIYLGELRRRMAELQAERTARIALVALIASGVAVVVTLLVFVLAL